MIEREKVVEEALTWVGTPYRLGACKKGVGVDCVQLLAAVFKAVGVVPESEVVGVFGHDWFSHTKEERYLKGLLKYGKLILESKAYRTSAALPGDVVLTKAAKSRVWNHGAIVVAWPIIIHAIQPQVEKVNATMHPLWTMRDIAILSLWNADAR